MGDTSNNFHFFVLHNCNILSPLVPTHETTDKPIKLHLNRQFERENVRFKSCRKYLKKKTSILQRSYFSSGNYKTTHFLICVKSEAKAELQAGKEKTSAVPSNTTHPPPHHLTTHTFNDNTQAYSVRVHIYTTCAILFF